MDETKKTFLKEEIEVNGLGYSLKNSNFKEISFGGK
jgi:hypothetical protein